VICLIDSYPSENQGQLSASDHRRSSLKRALKKRVKAVLNNKPSSDDAPVEHLNEMNPKANRRVRTQAAMIGLAISMGATSLLVTRQSDQAQAAAPVGSQKAASTIPAVSETELKFAATQLESQAVSSASAPENPIVVEPTAVSQVPGLEAKWQILANSMSVPVSATEADAAVANRNTIGLPHQLVSLSTEQKTYQLPETAVQVSPAEGVASSTTAPVTGENTETASSNVNAQLKAQQEFALNRLQEKSNRLRESLAELRSEESTNLPATGVAPAQPNTVAATTVPSAAGVTEANSDLIARLKQSQKAQTLKQEIAAPAPVKETVIAQSAATTYEVQPGDTLAAIAKNYGTSIAELVKVNNLSDPNQLQISQKLIIPSSKVKSSNTKLPTAPVNQVSINPSFPIAPQPSVGTNNSSITIPTSVAADNSVPINIPATENSVTVPTPVTPNNQTQANNSEIAPESIPTPANSYGMGGDSPVPTAFADYQRETKQPQKVARNKGNERLRNLQAEIERLRQKYRNQQNGVTGVTVSTLSESESLGIQTPVVKRSNIAISNRNFSAPAISIPVPRPILPSYSEEPVKKPLLRMNRPVNEPVNPEFVPNQASNNGWNAARNSSGIQIPVPSVGVNSAADSLGKLRGTQVSPQLPPLAAVDIYLPRAIDENTNPSLPSTSNSAYIWPAKGVLTSGYGWRWGRMHRGIDIANGVGTPIYASATGVVEKAGWNNGGYGNLVDIRHPDGSLTRYAHNSRILVRIGQQVQQGQQIATMGSTGFSTGPHSHFEIHPAGKGATNPIAFLPERV
jgi:murein DD-endopeptidase MepM/ murein hydrolase activator NlpD